MCFKCNSQIITSIYAICTEEIYQSIPHLEESTCTCSLANCMRNLKSSSPMINSQYLLILLKELEICAQYKVLNAIEIAYSIQTNDEALGNSFTRFSTIHL